jgi:single-stranded DNA-binding protein
VSARQLIEAKDDEASQYWRVIAFSEIVQAELLRLADGDTISMQGLLRAETYQAENGETKLSVDIIANALLPLRQSPRKREARGR